MKALDPAVLKFALVNMVEAFDLDDQSHYSDGQRRAMVLAKNALTPRERGEVKDPRPTSPQRPSNKEQS